MISNETSALWEHVDGGPTINTRFTGVGSDLKGPSQDLGGVGGTDDGGINGGARINVTGNVGTNRLGEKMAVWRDGFGREVRAVEVEGEG